MKPYTKLITILLNLLFISLCSNAVAADEAGKSEDTCYSGANAPFSEANLKMAEYDFESMTVSEDNAHEYHFQRELAEKAIIKAKENNGVVNSEDILLVKKCRDLNIKNANIEQLEHCMEVLHDFMENELAQNFNKRKKWEKLCESYRNIECKVNVDKYDESGSESLMVDENSVCQICASINKNLSACKKVM